MCAIELDGAELLLIIIAVFGGLIKLCMVFNESRIAEYDLCNGLIMIRRDPLDLAELQENHDAMENIDM